MSDTGLVITIKGTEETVRGLNQRQAALRKSMVQSLNDASLVVLRRATENLRGKVLHVDRGALWQRLSYNIFADKGIAKIGSPVIYAPVHEYGATIQHPGGTAYYFDERRDRSVFISNKAAARQGTKHAFPRTRPHPITIPARPWLRPALADSRKDVETIFRKAAQEALGEPTSPGTAS